MLTPITPRTPGSQFNPHGHDDTADALAQLDRWLAHWGAQRPSAVTSVEFDKLPGTLCVTVTFANGEVATCLLDLLYNYLATGEMWPWSWRGEAPGA
jgi:hypothetical protein